MRGDRRAEGGFFEAMVAMMLVSVALTALFGHMALWSSEDREPEGSIQLFTELKVSFPGDGVRLTGAEELLEGMLEDRAVLAAALELEVVGEDGPRGWRLMVGSPGDGEPRSERASRAIEGPGGLALPASYTLTVWHAV